MAEIFQLKGLTSEIHLTMEQNITFHKAFSKGESFAKKNVRPLYVTHQMSSFASHIQFLLDA